MTLVALTAALIGCSSSPEAVPARVEPFELELINEEEGLSRLILADGPVERIGIETESVRVADGRKTIPYGALLYHPEGNTYVYTNPERLVFVRQPVTVDVIEGDVVALNEGPAAGTRVVTVGGAELTGMEFGVGK